MRIALLASGRFALPTLTALAGAHDLALVITQPDRPAGRKRRLTPTPVAEAAEPLNLSLIKPEDVNAPPVLEQLTDASVDMGVTVDFGQYIRQPITQIPRLGMMNLHPSLLPKYRGAGPINWTIINGETQTGNTMIRIASKMDSGDILAQRVHPVDPQVTAGQLHDVLAEHGAQLVLDTLDQAAAGTLTQTPQDESKATLAPKLSRDDAVIDWGQSAAAIRNRIHGLTPWPGVTLRYLVGQRDEPPDVGNPEHWPRLKIGRCAVAEALSPPAGPGVMFEDGLVATGDQALRLLEVQPPGKRMMNWSDFQRGHALPTGTRFV